MKFPQFINVICNRYVFNSTCQHLSPQPQDPTPDLSLVTVTARWPRWASSAALLLLPLSHKSGYVYVCVCVKNES